MRSVRGGNLRAVPTAPGSEAPDDQADTSQVGDQSNAGINDLDNLPEAPKAMPIQPQSSNAVNSNDDELNSLPAAGGKLGELYDNVSGQDPDHVAKVLDASTKLGQDPSFVADNLTQAKKAADAPNADFFKSIEDRFPGTTKFLQDPKSMAVAHDDIPNLAKHEQLVEGIKQARTLTDSLLAGFEGSAIGMKSLGHMPDVELPKDAPIWNWLAAQGAGLAGDSMAMAAGGIVGAGAGATTGAITGGLAGAPFGGVGAIPGAAFGGFVGGIVGGGYGALAYPTALKEGLRLKYQQGDIKGVADILDRGGEVLKAANKQGLVGGLTAAVGLGVAAPFESAALKTFAPKIFGSTAIKTATALAAEDVTLTKASNAVEGKETDPKDYLGNALLIGGMHGASHLAAMGAEHFVEAKRTAQAQEFYDGIEQAGGASKLLKRLPPQYQEMLGNLTEDSPVENIHIPHEAWKEYFQSKNIDPAQAAEELGASESYNEAEKTGGTVSIPTEQFVSRVVGTEHYKGLRDDVKFDPQGFTVNEIKARQKEIQEQIKQAESEAQNGGPDQTAEESSQKVYDERHAQLTSAGVTPDEAKQGATLHQSAFKALAERMGADPYELSQKFKLELQRQGHADPDGRSYSQENPHFESPDAIENYKKIENTNGGRDIDPDQVRSLDPEYAAGREGKMVHLDRTTEPAAKLAQRMYEEHLKSDNTAPVVLMAGGTASGKTVYRTHYPHELEGLTSVYDTNSSNFEGTKGRIEQALNSGRQVIMNFAYRDFDTAVEGNAARFKSTGRLVHPHYMAFTHVHALDTFLKLAEEYKGDKRVSFAVFDSSSGKPDWFKTVDELDKLRYTSESKTANQAIKELEKRARGRLKDELAEVKRAKDAYRSGSTGADESGDGAKRGHDNLVEGTGAETDRPGSEPDTEAGPTSSVNPEDLKFSDEEKKSFEQSGLDLKRDGNVLDATDLFRKPEGKILSDDERTAHQDNIASNSDVLERTDLTPSARKALERDRKASFDIVKASDELKAAKEKDPKGLIEAFKARVGEDKKAQTAIDKAQSPKKGPYVEVRAIKGIRWTPNFEAEPTGIIGKEGISEPYPKKGDPDPLQWADSKFGATKQLMEKHKAADMPLTINTSSDLIGKSDYIEAMPKDTTVNMYLLGKNSEQNRSLFPGNASRLRQEKAIEALKAAGIKVNEVEPSAGDIIKAAGGVDAAAEKLGVAPDQVLTELQKSLGLRLVKSFDQESRGRISFQDSKAIINLFKDADRSTFLHESGHYFLEIMQHLSNTEGAPQVVKDDMAAIRNWMGLKDGEAIGTAQHEQFARGFENYLMEGNAPSAELRSAFVRFKNWLLGIYKSAKHLHADLSPEIRQVMDRMLATDDEITNAGRTIGVDMSKGMEVPESLKGKMNDLADQAREKAQSTLMREQMKELSESNKAFLTGERQRLQSEAETNAEQEPVFKAQNDIQEALGSRRKVLDVASKMLDGSIAPKDEAHFEAAAEVNGFADGKSLANEILASAANDAKAKGIADYVERGMAPHAHMMDRDQIKVEALRAIHNEHMTELLALEHQMLSAKVNEAQVNSEVSRRQRTEARIAAVEANAQAKQILGDKPIKDAGNFRIYTTAERNAAVKADAAIKREDYARAAEYKRQQMLNHALAAEALRNRDESESAVKLLEKASKRGQDLKDMPFAYNRQVDQLLERFGIKEKAPDDQNTLMQIAKDMQAKGESSDDVANATGMIMDPQTGQLRMEGLRDFISRVNENFTGLQLPESIISGEGVSDYKDMKMADLRDLKDAVKTITEIGKTQGRWLNNLIKLDMREAAALFKKGVTDLIGSPYAADKKIGSAHDSEWRQKVDNLKNLPDSMVPTLVNTLTLCHYLDGGENGPAHDYIYRPLKQAEDRKFARYAVMREAIRGKDGLFGKFYTEKELAAYKNKATELGGRTITKENILAMALNWGNESNRDRIRAGFGSRDGSGRLVPMSDETIQGLFKHLDKKDWDFAQAAWDHLDTYWPEIKALEMKVRGVEPGRVESAPFENEHGSYRGGYYPISYDFEKSSEAFSNEQQKTETFKQYSTASAQTERGHAIARTSFVARPLRLSLDVFFNHLENVVHDLEFRPAIIDASKFLSMPDVKNTLEDSLGMKTSRAIGDWLKAQGSDQSENLTYYEKAINWSRFGTTMASLGFKPAMLLLHGPSNVFHGIWEMGVKNTVSSMTQAMLDTAMGRGDLGEFVKSRSERMNQRLTIRDRDIMDMSKAWEDKPMLHGVTQYAFMVLHLADEAVSLPLWREVYQRNVAEFGEQKAGDMADETVTRTLGSGSKVDQIGAQRGSGIKKLLTMFYGWESVVFNRAWLDGKMSGLEYKQGNIGGAAATMAKATLFAFLLPAVHRALLGSLLHSGPESDSDQNKRIADSFLEEPFAKFPFVRDVAQSLIHTTLGMHGSDYKMSPIEMAYDNILKPAAHDVQSIFGQHGLGLTESNRDFNEKLVEENARGAAQLMGYPQQLNTWTFNFLDYLQNNGEVSMKSFLSRQKMAGQE